jgi:hypothetical protein
VQVSILGGAVDPKRKELSRQTLWFFIHGNYAAIKYGLDDEYVFNKLYDDLEVREKLTTLINAVSRGKIPKDGPEVMAAAKEIKKIYDSRLINNTGFFEANEDEAKKQLDTDVLTPEEAFPVDMQKGKLEKKREIEENNPSSETPEEAEFRLQKEILLRDQEHDERINKNKENMIEEDRDRHVRSEGSLLMRNFIKRYLK